MEQSEEEAKWQGEEGEEGTGEDVEAGEEESDGEEGGDAALQDEEVAGILCEEPRKSDVEDEPDEEFLRHSLVKRMVT